MHTSITDRKTGSARAATGGSRERQRPGVMRLRHGLAAALLWLVDRLLGPIRARSGEAGMTTAEYAVGTIAACGFAAILYQVVTGDSVISALDALIAQALSSL